MKTVKSMLAAVTLLFVCVAANATTKHVANQPSQNDVVNIYINAITNGNTSDLDKILDDDMQFNVKHGQDVNTINKDQLISTLKSSEVSNEKVNTSTTVMQQDDNSAKIKIEFKYAGYTRVDVVTLNKTFGWKITNVYSSFS